MTKTVSVIKLREKANHYLLNSPDDMISARHAVGSFIASVLHDTDNYKGFGYLTAADMNNSSGSSVGINGEHGLFPCALSENQGDGRFDDTDNSRICYY